MSVETIRIERDSTASVYWRWNGGTASPRNSTLSVSAQGRHESDWLGDLSLLARIAERLFRQPGNPGRPPGPGLLQDPSVERVREADEFLIRRDGRRPSHEALAEEVGTSVDTIKCRRKMYTL